MTERVRWLIGGCAAGATVGVAAGYGLAWRTGQRGIENSKYSALTATMPTDVKTAWDNYVQAQRAYMAAVKQAKKADGQGARGEGRGAVQSRILNPQPSTLNTHHSTTSTQRSTLSPAAKEGTWIAFDDTVVDFGTVDQGTESTSAFLYRNKGTQMLRIGDVTSSCGCAVAQPEPRDVPPGGVGLLKVSFKSGSFSGPIKKTITVRSNDPAAWRWRAGGGWAR